MVIFSGLVQVSADGALLEGRVDVLWESFVGLTQLVLAVGVRAVLVEFAFTFFLPKVAKTCLIIVVWDIHHAHHKFSRQWL